MYSLIVECLLKLISIEYGLVCAFQLCVVVPINTVPNSVSIIRRRWGVATGLHWRERRELVHVSLLIDIIRRHLD